MTTTAPDRRSLQFLDDYCPRCNPAGHHADSRVRSTSLTEPTMLTCQSAFASVPRVSQDMAERGGHSGRGGQANRR
jgi:hypothetical protein